MFVTNRITRRISVAEMRALETTPITLVEGLPGIVMIPTLVLSRRTEGTGLATQMVVTTDGFTGDTNNDLQLDLTPLASASGRMMAADSISVAGKGIILTDNGPADYDGVDFEVEVTLEYISFPLALKQPKTGWSNSNNDA